MDSIATLTTLLEQAEVERDQAQTALRQAEAGANAARAQSQNLEGYRGDYQQRWGSRFRHQSTPELLHCYQGFSQRLNQAIEQQGHVLRQAETRLERAQATLIGREQRVAAVRKLIERRRAELERGSARREQRQSDDAAQRALAHRRLAAA
ncbi:MAG: flagellar export protein FliJ [Burkholderiales bacterium]|nr:flagellar export protein FliJ [Burkholderiales bacterium]